MIMEDYKLYRYDGTGSIDWQMNNCVKLEKKQNDVNY